MVEPAKNSIWIYLIPLWQLEQVSSTFGRRGVEVSLTSHFRGSCYGAPAGGSCIKRMIYGIIL